MSLFRGIPSYFTASPFSRFPVSFPRATPRLPFHFVLRERRCVTFRDLPLPNDPLRYFFFPPVSRTLLFATRNGARLLLDGTRSRFYSLVNNIFIARSSREKAEAARRAEAPFRACRNNNTQCLVNPTLGTRDKLGSAIDATVPKWVPALVLCRYSRMVIHAQTSHRLIGNFVASR